MLQDFFKHGQNGSFGPPKKDPNEAKMEPERTKNEPKVDNSGAKGEVLDHVWKMAAQNKALD